MTHMTSFAPGTFSWVELGTPDLASATAFYRGLFGWATEEVSSEEGIHYVMGSLHDRPVAGLYQLSQQQIAQGFPSHWLSYIAVENVAETADKAVSLGGTVVAPAMDVQDLGRMAVIQDPSGALFALWQARAHAGSGLVNEPGALTWNELATRHTDTVTRFYCELFGWASDAKEMGPLLYTTFSNHEGPVGGMLQMTEEWGKIPPHWMVYFAVGDCDEAARLAGDLGAVVPVPPTDLPDVGRFALVQDPQGATFSVIRLTDRDG